MLFSVCWWVWGFFSINGMKLVENYIAAVVWKKYSLLHSPDTLATHQRVTDNAFDFQESVNKFSISVVLDVD